MSITHDKQPQELIDLGAIRERLTTTRTYYVRTDGSDSNDGLTNSAGGAFATLQKACDVVACDIDLATFSATISIQSGTYNEDNIILREPLCSQADTGNSILIEGSGTVTLNATGRNIEVATGSHRIRFNNLSFQATAENIKLAASGGVLRLSDCTFNTSGNECVNVRSLSKLVVTNTNINVNSPSTLQVFFVEKNSILQLQSSSITFGTGPTPSLTNGLFRIRENSTAVLTGVTYVNSFTGKAYTIEADSSLIASTPTNYTNIPGTTAGTIEDNCSLDDLTGLQINNKIRERLTGSRTYYVRTDGSDSNDGLTNDANGAFLTITKAAEQVQKQIDGNRFSVTISVNAGTYTGFSLFDCVGVRDAKIIGVGAVTITSTILCRQTETTWILENLTLETVNDNITIFDSFNALLRVKDVTFNVIANQAFVLSDSCGGKIILEGTTRILDTSFQHFFLVFPLNAASVGVEIYITGTVEFNATTPTISGDFICLRGNAHAYLRSVTWVNTFTGKTFTLENSATLSSTTGNINEIPGTVAGTLEDSCSFSEFSGLQINNKISGFTLTGGGAPGAAGFTGEGQYDEINDILYIYDGTTWNPH